MKLERFTEPEPNTGCWLFTGSLTRPQGYGQIRFQGGWYAAHRLSYLAEHGPVAQGLELDHLCRQRSCLNPSHLEPVPHVENTRRGLAAKFSHRLVADIREWLAEGETQSSIARKLGVTPGAINHVARGRRWALVSSGAVAP